MTEPHDIPMAIVFKKLTLYDKKCFRTIGLFYSAYRLIGYKTIAVSAKEGTGIETLNKN